MYLRPRGNNNKKINNFKYNTLSRLLPHTHSLLVVTMYVLLHYISILLSFYATHPWMNLHHIGLTLHATQHARTLHGSKVTLFPCLMLHVLMQYINWLIAYQSWQHNSSYMNSHPSLACNVCMKSLSFKIKISTTFLYYLCYSSFNN